MSKSKKSKAKSTVVAPAAKKPSDPHAVLKHPANPPRPNVASFLIALGVFFCWFLFLVYVAVWGRV